MNKSNLVKMLNPVVCRLLHTISRSRFPVSPSTFLFPKILKSFVSSKWFCNNYVDGMSLLVRYCELT